MTDLPTSQPISRRRFLFRAAGGAALVVSLPELLAACTVGQPSTSTASGSPGGPSTSTLRIGWSSEPDTMNPLTSYSTEALEVQQLIYDKLTDYDANLKPVPALTTSSDVSSDGKTVTYHLRQGVTWHDGQPFTAADVVFTYQTIADQGSSGYAQWLGDMQSVKAQGNDVVVTWSKPQAFDPALAVPILPEHIWKGMSAADVQKFANDKPVGTGPYTFEEWKRGQTVSVNRNDKFWGTPPGPGAILWQLYQNEDVMAQSLRAGEVDILTEVPPTIYDGLGGVTGLTPVSLPGFSFHHIGMNVSTASDSKGSPLLLQKEMRQALACAVDRNQLVQIALAGHGKPGVGLIPPALSAFQLQLSDDQQLNNNQDKANQLLDGLGYTQRQGDGTRLQSNGQPVELRLIAIESTTVDVRAAQLFRDACQKVGVKLDLQTMDENTLGSVVYDTTDWDLFVWGWDSGVNDPDYLLGVPLTSQIGGNNDVYYSNKQYDDLYAKQASELNEQTRIGLVQQTQQLYYDDSAYIVMWYQDKLQAYRSDKWGGFADTPGGIVFNFTRANYTNATPVA
jgi:peptide/nickel transport system substrate-binding protein